MSDLAATVANLRRLRDEATPGPWRLGDWDGQCHLPHAHSGRPRCQYDYTLRPHKAIVSGADPVEHLTIAGENDYGPVLSKANAALIVSAVNALPTLLEAVEERDRLREAIEAYRAACPPQWFRLTTAEQRLFAAALTEVDPHA